MENQNRVMVAWKTLRYSFAVVVLLAGLDKVLGTNLITDWAKYISPFVSNMIPLSAHAFVVIIGVIEVVAALLLFSRYTALASFIASAWLVLIAINLLMLGGYVDIAVRDVLLALCSFATGQLSLAQGYTLTGRKM